MEQDRRVFRAKKTPKSKPIIVGPPKSLIKLINEGNRLDALRAIKNNNFIENEVDASDNNTPLMLACEKNFDDIALALIASGKSKPSHLNYEGETAIIISCSKNMLEVSKKLLETGEASIDQTTAQGETPLIIACSFPDTEEITLEMIKTGKSIPEQVDVDNATALIMACQNKLTKTALELIKTGKSNWFITDVNGYTALEYASQNSMDEVVNAIQRLGFSEVSININELGFNPIEVNEEVVKDFLLDDPNNLCFKYEKKNYLTSRSYIDKFLSDKNNIKYRCILAGDNKYDDSGNLISMDYTADKNIRYNEQYFSMSQTIGLPILVRLSELNHILDNAYSSNMYYLSPSGSFPALVSLDYVDGGSGVGADHCQTGKKTQKCSIIPAIATCLTTQIQETKPVLIKKTTELEQPESQSSLQVKIQYKTKTLVIPIDQTTTIGKLKELLLEKLVSENDIDNVTNKNVRLIYTGKIYGNDKNEMIVTSLPNFTNGITMASTVQQLQAPVIGGKKRKTKKRIHNKKRYTRSKKYSYKY
jgi:ankyrin repeat protein